MNSGQLTALLAALCSVATATQSCVFADESNLGEHDVEYFEREIRPLLAERCYSCHSSKAKTVHGGLRLDTDTAIQQGGDSGAVIVAGAPDDSLLVQVIRYGGDIEMPPAGKLPDREIEVLTEWIRRGAFVPPSDDQARPADSEIDFEEGRTFWSFQPVREHSLPDVTDTEWPNNRVDAFVLAVMEREGLQPSPQADRRTLIRRLSFELTGLPPTPDAVDAFVNDDAPDAYEQLIERLLDSPHYGEKWARMWLDAARYTDRTASWLSQGGQPHLYRDWVVRAFNDDMPYDDFVRRQLATDLMPDTGPEDRAALGFVSLSPTYWKELQLPCEIIKVIVADEWEEKVDAVSQTFLGLTVACARCHDHKFDPISSEDYYALAGVFASCRSAERPLLPDEDYEPARLAKEEVARLGAEVEKLRKETPPPEARITELTARVAQLKSTPFYDAPVANALAEESLYVERAGKTAQDGTRLDYRPGPRDLPLFIRGNPNRLGEIVPRRFLTVLSEQPQPFANGSGRLELAQAITTDAASLTARVIVNRIWLAHFGRGLVATPSNFGQQGERPSHPELLDDLAARFIAGGWSTKDLHREILHSATWQQSAVGSDASIAADPDNRWYSRANRRRLDFESWRDAMLSVSGVLDPTTGGESISLDEPGNRRRTLYGTVHRRELSTTLQIHDFPDPNQHSAQRSFTTTALQGLYALNGPLLAEQSRAVVDRLRTEFPDDDNGRITRVYRLLFSRSPTDRERSLALNYLGDSTGADRTARWQQYAHALLASNEFLFVD